MEFSSRGTVLSFFPFADLDWQVGLKALTLFIILISILVSISIWSKFKSSFPFIDEELRMNAVPEYGFFFSITRAWELLFGSLTAIYLLYKRR